MFFVCNWLLIAMFIYSLFELEISVKFYVIDVIFNEKWVIGESVGFLWILYLYRKKVVWVVGLDLGYEMGKSVDFSGVLRYWGRYLDF